MYLGISSSLAHESPREWAQKHKALGLQTVNFPVSCDDGEETFMAYKQAADEAGLTTDEEYIASVQYVQGMTYQI